MGDRVHFIPVGFDFDRLIRPIAKDELRADRVVLLTHEGEPTDDPTDRAVQLASNMRKKLVNTFELIDVEVEIRGIELETLYQYEDLYPMAYQYFLDEIENGNEVFVNISSMPRTVSFAFATAADSLITEKQDEIENIRDRLHTYYVAPKEYLVLEMIDVLESQAELLEDLKEYEDLRVHDQMSDVQDILERIEENGVTEGTRDDLGGETFIEFPSSPSSNVEEFEEVILRFLVDKGNFDSTSELAKQLAENVEEEYDESFRSRVQYNVSKLDKKGYVSRTKTGNRLETTISTMGRMWVETH